MRALEAGQPAGHRRDPGRCAEKLHHDGLVGTRLDQVEVLYPAGGLLGRFCLPRASVGLSLAPVWRPLCAIARARRTMPNTPRPAAAAAPYCNADEGPDPIRSYWSMLL